MLHIVARGHAGSFVDGGADFAYGDRSVLLDNPEALDGFVYNGRTVEPAIEVISVILVKRKVNNLHIRIGFQTSDGL